MKRFAILALLASTLTGCAALKDAGNSVVDGLMTAPTALHGAFSQILHFVWDLLLTFFAHFAAGLGI